MVNSNSDPERAQGPVATSLHYGKLSSLSADKLTRRMGASMDIPEKNPAMNRSEESLDAGSNTLTKDGTHRFLKSRHIQLIGIGGTIGTALYVQIGQSLLNGGPASLFLAFTIWLVLITLLMYSSTCRHGLHSIGVTVSQRTLNIGESIRAAKNRITSRVRFQFANGRDAAPMNIKQKHKKSLHRSWNHRDMQRGF